MKGRSVLAAPFEASGYHATEKRELDLLGLNGPDVKVQDLALVPLPHPHGDHARPSTLPARTLHFHCLAVSGQRVGVLPFQQPDSASTPSARPVRCRYGKQYSCLGQRCPTPRPARPHPGRFRTSGTYARWATLNRTH
ncbi:hypothetical protein MPNT_80063 [Candidatus Methylacidithermus pantelleriae]|uniref:Uncharacterized protein n=1 Tax=Candidatus Methylacidithermus pantelleriae TaxID=2744239 RepID=A0A8J2BSU7_9BACT|nr:hypothetical protein MPNT_80063 [Candidatus Methylacidithermus pantelleriae]